MRRLLPTVCILTLVHFCSFATAENVSMTVKSQQAKVYKGKTVVATVKQFLEVTQTSKKGKWVGIQWEAEDGKIKRG